MTDPAHSTLEAEWDELADRTGAPPWLRPGWMVAWNRAFGTGELEPIEVRQDGRLVGLAGVERGRGRLRSATNWHSPGWGLLAASEPDRQRLADELFRARPARVDLAFLEAGGPSLAVCRSTAQACGYRVLERELNRSPYLDVAGDWENFRPPGGRSLLADLRKKRRRLERAGELRFELDRCDEALDERMDEAFRVEAAGWKGSGGTAMASDPATRGFYLDLARWAAGRGQLRLACLRLDGRLIAFTICVDDGARMYTFKTGFDEEFARFSPGKVLLQQLIEYSFGSSIERYEFLGAAAPYKLRWTETFHEQRLLQAFRRGSPAGLGGWAAFRYGRPLAIRVLRR